MGTRRLWPQAARHRRTCVDDQLARKPRHAMRRLAGDDQWLFCFLASSAAPMSVLRRGSNIAVYFMMQGNINSDFVLKHLTVSYDGVVNHGRYHTLLTSAFMHGSLGHLAGNLISVRSRSLLRSAAFSACALRPSAPTPLTAPLPCELWFSAALLPCSPCPCAARRAWLLGHVPKCRSAWRGCAAGCHSLRDE